MFVYHFIRAHLISRKDPYHLIVDRDFTKYMQSLGRQERVLLLTAAIPHYYYLNWDRTEKILPTAGFSSFYQNGEKEWFDWFADIKREPARVIVSDVKDWTVNMPIPPFIALYRQKYRYVGKFNQFYVFKLRE